MGGGDESSDKAYDTACCLLHHMNEYDILSTIVTHNTNNKPADKDETALEGVRDIIRFFNSYTIHGDDHNILNTIRKL